MAPPTTFVQPEPINKTLEAISFCESGGRQFYPDGTVVTGKIDPRDTGKYQISTHYHGETANKMGLDLFTEEGNEAYAKWLFEKEGTKPWNASKECWYKMI